MTTQSLLRPLSLILALTTGCGFVQIRTGDATPAAGEGVDPPGDVGAGPADGHPVSRAYASWTHASCGPKEWCGSKLAKAAGIHPDGQRNGAIENPTANMRNPDPEWLPGWDALPATERDATAFFEALNLAATRKTWLADCKAAHANVKQGLDERLERATTAIAAAQAIADPYARLQAFLELPTRPIEDLAGKPHREFTAGLDAAAYETERAAYEAFRKEGKLWLFRSENLVPRGATMEILAPRWAPALEERAFCVHAAERGYDTLPPLPRLNTPYVDDVVAHVKPIFTEAELLEIERERAARAERAQRELVVDDVPKRLDRFTSDEGARVRKFVVANGQVRIELHRQHEYGRSIGDLCTDGAGRIGSCPVMRVKKFQDWHITFAEKDWPAGLTIETGDRISILSESRVTRSDGAGTPREDWAYEHEGLLVRAVFRKNGDATAYLLPVHTEAGVIQPGR